MPYKFDQMMVNLLGGVGKGGTRADRTCFGTGNPISNPPTGPDGYILGVHVGTLMTLGLARAPQPTSAASLAALKEQLKQQLAAIEEQEKTTAEAMRPQSVEEVDALTEKLNGALGELKARRAELAAKPAPAVKKRAAKKSVPTV